jgi:hypothetical protein
VVCFFGKRIGARDEAVGILFDEFGNRHMLILILNEGLGQGIDEF